MKSFVLALIIFLVGNISFAQNKTSSDTTRKKTSQTKISDGASGVRRSIGYKFSSTVTDADPGEGIFRYNNPSVSKVTWVFVDDTDISGEDQTKWYTTWNDTTGATARGSINIVENEGKNINYYNVTGVFIKEQGYWKIPVEYVTGDLPAEGGVYYYVFNRIAHKKPQVPSVPQPVPEAEPVPAVQPEPVPIVQPQPEPDVQPVTVAQPVPQQQPATEKKPEPLPEEPTAPQKEQKPAETQTVRTTQTRQTTQNAEARQPVRTTQTTEPAQQAKPAQLTQPKQTNQTKQPAQNTQTYQQAPYNPVSQTKRPVDIANPYANTNISGTARGKCYRGIIEIGYAWGVGDYGINNFRFNFINGIMIGKVSSVGLGLGYRRYFEGLENYTGRKLYSPADQIPVFLDLRTSFTKKKVTPYLALGIGGSAGYLKVSSDSATIRQEGLYFCPSGGIWFNISDRLALFGGIAFEMQRLEYILIADNSHFKRNTSSLSVNIGIAF
ncbi:MAG: hypothetical protein MUF36_05850 [Bacteroidales bacterium]|jgi:hypothetical protein|nr:hypothetical protein [Bacteroidales bacterium]